jgi:hypothetical protein
MSQFTDMLGSTVLSEEVRDNINAAWEKHLAESREEVTAELREEFASRYEHDKSQLIEAMDKLMQDTINAGAADLKTLREEAMAQRTKYAAKIKEDTALLQKLVIETLSKEIQELRSDRAGQKEAVARLEEFALRKLTGELAELHEDHKRLVEARVKLVAEGRNAINEAKSNFVKKASEKVNALVTETFKKEMTQLKTDIREAKENNFGRKIMEAFAAEFMASKFADGTTVSQLNRKIEEIQSELTEAKNTINQKEEIISESLRRQRIAEDQAQRVRVMQDLCAPLSKDKRAIMEELLESTDTSKLKDQFQKFLPSVLNEEVRREKKQLIEGQQSQKTVITGNKTQTEPVAAPAEADDTIQQLRKLAGIKI